MGNSAPTALRVNFEDMQEVVRGTNRSHYILISTLPPTEQGCLLPNTIPIHEEENIINQLLRNGQRDWKVIVYGKHTGDDNMYKKYQQLVSLGFYNTFLYPGGLFEWLLLQDIYGDKDFPTTSKEMDLLKYKPNKRLNVLLLR